jgi:2-keto-3-deoxy-L-rhamnonate aldolase RhmA
MKGLKKRLKDGETLIGCWLNLGSSITAEMVGMSGFDWVLLDLEHGAGEQKDLLHQLQALEHTPAASIVRVESGVKERIHRVLDLGAEGIMCPRINDLSEAKNAIQGILYPPEGIRGVAKMVRATGFGKNFSQYYSNAKNDIVGVVQIETKEVLQDVDAIAAMDGVDVLFIGPADLSMALGIFGEFEHPKFKEAVEITVNAARKAGKATGILIFDPDEFIAYKNLGIQLIACGSDGSFVAYAANDLASRLNNMKNSRP